MTCTLIINFKYIENGNILRLSYLNYGKEETEWVIIRKKTQTCKIKQLQDNGLLNKSYIIVTYHWKALKW